MTRLAAEIAAAQFASRVALLTHAVAEGKLEAGEANQRALPWLAIAAAAGAEVPELYFDDEVWRPGRGWAVERQRLASSDICEPAEWRQVLADARDAAFRQTILRPSAEATDAARDLSLLARTLRAPPVTVEALQEAA